MDNNSNAITIEHVVYQYDPGRSILDDINLAIAENEFVAIIGQNGSGKTTLLKNISGLLRPQQGTISIRGNNAENMSITQIAAHIGFVMQECDRQLFEQTVYDEVAFALKHILPRHAIREKVEESLAAVGLTDKRDAFPLALNRADRVKTIFAAILAMGPDIIMLDEPAAGQDKRGCRMIMDLAADLHRQNYTIIMVTHNISITAEYARRIIVMQEGGIYMDGNPKDIFSRENELLAAGILPPQITQLSTRIRGDIPLEKDALLPAELAAMLVKSKNKIV